MVKNEDYELRFDAVKNRIFMKMNGFWGTHKLAVAEQFKKDFEKMAAQAKKGFTLVGDLVDMKPPSSDIGAILEGIQKSLVAAGMKKVAEIVSPNILTSKSVERTTANSGMNKIKKDFSSIQEAEVWLDQP